MAVPVNENPLAVNHWPLIASVLAASLFLHVAGLETVTRVSTGIQPSKRSTVKFTVEEPPPKVEEPPPPPPPPPPKPKPKAPPPAAPATKAAERPKDDLPPPAPIQGLTKDSFTDGASTFSAPAGNTMMKEDTGERLRPEDIAKLDRDLSADARLIPSSFLKPEYTPEALDAAVEGRFQINFFVEKDGSVSAANLERKIGFGMDARVLAAAQKATFVPRKDAIGRSIAGWARLTVELLLP